jgi:hypothetical protein
LKCFGTWASQGVPARAGVASLIEVETETAFLLPILTRLWQFLLFLVKLDSSLIFFGFDDLGELCPDALR